MTQTMTKAEVLSAALALDAWMRSQDIKGHNCAVVAIHYLSAQAVAQGTTPQRFDFAIELLSSLLKNTCHEAMGYAKRVGLR